MESKEALTNKFRILSPRVPAPEKLEPGWWI